MASFIFVQKYVCCLCKYIQNDFVKMVDFHVFLVLTEFRYDFYQKFTIFALNFHLNPLYGAVEAS